MIDRIRLLRNIGQFDAVNAGAQIPLARVTVMYSENGRGKTTLAAILRSLASGDPLPIAERRRLAALNPPHVVLECSDGPSPAVFENGAWNRTLARLVVFDDVFIDESVHSGLAVHAQHRQKLHELVLGAQAVALSRELQQLVERIEGHNRELRAKERAIPLQLRGPFSVDQFCELPTRADINQAIQEADRALAAALGQEAIRTTLAFDPLRLPAFDVPAIVAVLGQDLATVDTATMVGVQEHLRSLGHGGEDWVSDGMRRIRPDNAEGLLCPFCRQNLAGSPVIDLYRTYFSEAYGRLKRSIAQATAAIRQSHAGDVPAAFERSVRVAVERRQFWSRFVDVPELALNTAAIALDWRTARQAVVAQLTAKEQAPLERFQLSDETRALVAQYEQHRERLAAISQQFEAANQAVAVAKERAATGDARMLADDLSRLRAVKARHDDEVRPLCQEYLEERSAKEATERERDEVRNELEQHRTTVFPGYQTAINVYLARFNAGFRLDQMTHANTRGGPTCTYNVLINNTAVPVGADLAPGEPSFRSTLSAGDRNTLALAFFFASLDQDPDLANKVVVIDDPVSSLDEHRALTTAQEIRRLSQRAAQVIVLSHSKPLLARLWDGTDDTQRAALEVVRDGPGSSLRVWNVAQDGITEHDQRNAKMREFLTNGVGDRREVARSIRPHLEAVLRVLYPERFPPGSLLGPFRNQCRQRLNTPQQLLDEAETDELDDVVEFANRFHHDTNTTWETEAINDGELSGFVERALRFGR